MGNWRHRIVAIAAILGLLGLAGTWFSEPASATSAVTQVAPGYSFDSPSHSAPLHIIATDHVASQSVAESLQRTEATDTGSLSIVRSSFVATNSGNHVFWSGGGVAKSAATDFARANGARTLEMTMVGRALERLPYNRFTAKLWDAASAGFAATARGEAPVFLSPSFRGGASVFSRIEEPILSQRGIPIIKHSVGAS